MPNFFMDKNQYAHKEAAAKKAAEQQSKTLANFNTPPPTNEIIEPPEPYTPEFEGSDIFFIPFFLFSINSSAEFILQSSQISANCLDLQIEVLIEPFCQGSVNGGQLKVNISSGFGSGDYSYQWLDDNGGYLPGGPQMNSTTLSKLDIIDTYVYRVGLLQGNFSLSIAAGLFKGLIGFVMIMSTHYLAKKLSGRGLW